MPSASAGQENVDGFLPAACRARTPMEHTSVIGWSVQLPGAFPDAEHPWARQKPARCGCRLGPAAGSIVRGGGSGWGQIGGRMQIFWTRRPRVASCRAYGRHDPQAAGRGGGRKPRSGQAGRCGRDGRAGAAREPRPAGRHAKCCRWRHSAGACAASVFFVLPASQPVPPRGQAQP